MKPNCLRCKHYYITFDVAAPKGCRVYGIKSSVIPSSIVKQANNGIDCIGYSEKLQKKDKTKNLNDDKYWKA
jgi:hypothetical protein